MLLHKNVLRFTEVINATANLLNINSSYVEKDYWQIFAIHVLQQNKLSDDIILKGGTALSKCFELVKRAPDDIDFVVARKDGETDSKLKSKLKKINSILSKDLPEIAIDGLTRKMGMNRKTAHSYWKPSDSKYCPKNNLVVIDYSWLGEFKPYSKRSCNSIIGNALKNNGQNALVEQFLLFPIDINVLDPFRTFCEKIMSLVRCSYSDVPIPNLVKKIKHTYDLHQLLQYEEFKFFLQSDEFLKMMMNVAIRDSKSLRNNNIWLKHHPIESLFFDKLPGNWIIHFSQVYNTEFSAVVHGDLPSDIQILETLVLIKNRLKGMFWNIEIS
ncbi:nucleotidyl transferase AbiEii/AbiGii toxin family protein [Sphingobacterium multivorum]|uniref:nucleotidyl transferase AbiEii/AbiGii toxin family protein n=1 Tax=Sphingobacterium multivorum TaxID=28454 RepID=UPI0031BB2FA0